MLAVDAFLWDWLSAQSRPARFTSSARSVIDGPSSSAHESVDIDAAGPPDEEVTP